MNDDAAALREALEARDGEYLAAIADEHERGRHHVMTQNIGPGGHDHHTGELVHEVGIHVQLHGEPVPLMFHAVNWNAVATFLRSADFRRLAGRVEFVTLTNRADQGEGSANEC